MGLLKRRAAQPEPEPEPEPAPTLLSLVAEQPAARMMLALATMGGVDAADGGGWSCLHHAASLGSVAHVEALLDAGADATLPTSAPSGSFAKGLTPIDIAQQVAKTGMGNRDSVLHVLFLGVQAKGWGSWRDVQQADAREWIAPAAPWLQSDPRCAQRLDASILGLLPAGV